MMMFNLCFFFQVLLSESERNRRGPPIQRSTEIIIPLTSHEFRQQNGEEIPDQLLGDFLLLWRKLFHVE